MKEWLNWSNLKISNKNVKQLYKKMIVYTELFNNKMKKWIT